MGQCVCGQYFNPGDVQCRFCGRILQDATYQGYDHYAAYPPKPGAEYDPGFQKPPAGAQQGAYSPEPPQAGAQQGFDAGQRQYPQQPQYQQPQQPPSAMAKGMPQPPQGAQPAPKPVQKPIADKADFAVNPEVLSIMRSLKKRSLAQLIIVIVGFALSVGATGYLVVVLNAILEAMK